MGMTMGVEPRLLTPDEVAPKLVTIFFDDPAAIMYGFEPAFAGGEVVGRITSGNFGYSVGKFIGLAQVASGYAGLGTALEVQYTEQRYRGIVAEDVAFDPAMERMKV